MVIQKLFLRRIVKISRVFLIVMLSVVMTGIPGPWVSKTTASDWIPMLPDQDFYDFQLFAPPDLGSYNMYERDDDGFYFNYNRLYWGITIPRTVVTGETQDGLTNIVPSSPISPFTVVDLNNDYLEFSQDNPIVLSTTTTASAGAGANQPINTTEIPNVSQNITLFEIGSDPLRLDLNTSWMRTKMTWGDRYEGGWSYGGRGVHLSYFQVGKQFQSFGSVNEFAVNSPTTTTTFTQPGGGGGGNNNNNNNGGGLGADVQTITLETEIDSPQPDHLITQDLLQRNTTEIQSASVALTLRKRLGRRKGSSRLTYSLGPRFVQVADRYELDYVSFQNTFNTQFGGGGQQQGGGQQGGQQQGGQQQGGQQQGGQQQGGQQQGGQQQGGQQQGGQQQITGPGGDVAETFTTGLGGAGALGITIGDLPSTMTGTGPGSVFQTADWETYTSNNMVGPEFGMMFEGSQGAWDWYAGGTFTAAFNWQNNIYKGANLPTQAGADYLRTNFSGGGLTSIAYSAPGAGDTSVSVVQVPPSPLVTQIFPVGQSNTTNKAEHSFTFAPIGEWRFGGRYRISQAISLNFGYTGMWLSQIARASTNTKFQTVVKQTARASQNLTASTTGGQPSGGQTAVVDANNLLQGYEPNGQTSQLPNGWQRVPPTVNQGTDVVRNPQQFVEYNSSNYTQQAPNAGANEYVLTNGIDFGVEIKY